MKFTKRQLLVGGAAALVAAATGLVARRSADTPSYDFDFTGVGDTVSEQGMVLRDFGATGMKVSEVGFGAWGIGGNAYGDVSKDDALRALARAEELGCNFVDTAAVYGGSEKLLGEFLKGRRSRWIISTKFSAQPEGMERTIEDQLRHLGTDTIDFYQVHWAPGRGEEELYEQLYRLKKSGKARSVGVSLKSAGDIDHVLDDTDIDGFMVRFSLLDPEPFLSRLHRFREKRPAIIVRSALKEGFLTGKYKRDAVFTDPGDQRSSWSPAQIAETVDAVEKFRFLEEESGSMVVAAARYPLSFPETSTVIMGTKNESQANGNFGTTPGGRLSPASLQRIHRLQIELGLRSWRSRLAEAWRGLQGNQVR